jgi:hypothetical protein
MLSAVAWSSIKSNCGYVVKTRLVEEVSSRRWSMDNHKVVVDTLVMCGPWKQVGDVGLFWMHYSLQEFLAVQFVCIQMPETLLHKLLVGDMERLKKKEAKPLWSTLFYWFVCGVTGDVKCKHVLHVVTSMFDIIWC